MSKFPEILLPTLGGIAIILGAGYGLVSRDYGRGEIDLLQARLSRVTAEAEAARQAAEAVNKQAAEAADRAAELGQKVAEMESRSGAARLGDPLPESGVIALGRPALPEEVAAWNIDVRPDGAGLPEGHGDVSTGDEVFSENCAMCHGDFGEAVGRWPVLAGGADTLASSDPVKTIGSYWPYLSTVFDYVNRTMPFGNARSLTPDEVYAVTAYLLYLNDLVDEDFELARDNFAEVKLPNEGNFLVDDRPQVEYTAFSAEACMENCKDSVEITGRSRVVDVTPEDTAARKAREQAAAEAAAAPARTEPAEDGAADVVAGLEPALVQAGKKVFRKCKSCHAVGNGARNKAGPVLNGVVGRTIGTAEGFRYSGVFTTATQSGRVWDEAELAAFLAKPRAYMQGTKMSFSGLKKDADRKAIIAYLKSLDAQS